MSGIFSWIGRHIILTVGVIAIIIAILILRRKGSSSADASGVVYDGGVDPQTATAEVQANAQLAALQYQSQAGAASADAAVQANHDTIGGQIALATIQAQALGNHDALAAQVASQEISASTDLGKNTNSTNVLLAQTAASQAEVLANTNAGIINNQTSALVDISSQQQQTNRAQIKANSKGLCHITTIVCDVLGYADDCSVLEKLRHFRDTWLKEFYPFHLAEYHTIAPAIVLKIQALESNAKHVFCQSLYDNYLALAVAALDADKPAEALSIYVAMVKRCETI